MRTAHHILISCVLTLLCFCAITYSACKKDECLKIVCQNGGHCSKGACVCPSAFEGTYCDKISCAGINCLNGGMCISGKCNCPTGFYGDNCEVLNKYVGNYKATDNCNGSTTTYDINITMNPAGSDNVIKITGIGHMNTYVYAHLSDDRNSFGINGTTYEGYFFEGGGTYNNGIIQVGYTITIGSSFTSCSGTWIKQ